MLFFIGVFKDEFVVCEVVDFLKCLLVLIKFLLFMVRFVCVMFLNVEFGVVVDVWRRCVERIEFFVA